ncbi:MAG: lipase family alpha/beta hydrolase [Burkholderiaceae bacterium]
MAAFAFTVSLGAGLCTAAHADTYTQTKYPVVLVHGLFGFDSIGPADYFYGVPAALTRSGAKVVTPSTSAANTSEVRGEQLRAQLRALRAAYGYQKFNLIGHSHGAQTVRYVAGVEPGLVASVLTVGGVNGGSKVADTVLAGTSATGTTPAVAAIVNAFGSVISYLSGAPRLPQNSEGALRSLTTAGAADFSRRFPQAVPSVQCGQGQAVVGGVRYYSASGTSVLTNVFDPTDALLGLTSVLFGFEANDGLVSRCSSHLGVTLRDNYDWNHLDEVNQGFGFRGLFSQDPVAFYRSHANRLKNLGL